MKAPQSPPSPVPSVPAWGAVPVLEPAVPPAPANHAAHPLKGLCSNEIGNVHFAATVTMILLSLVLPAAEE